MRTNAIVLAASAAAGMLMVVRFLMGRPLVEKGTEEWYNSLPTYTLKNALGMEVSFSPIGAAILKMLVPDKRGNLADVVLGFEQPADYMLVNPPTYFGGVVGRVANRIAKAQFTLGGVTHKLLANNGPNALHGGALGLHRRQWSVRRSSTPYAEVVEFRYTSPAGEEGYPGRVSLRVTYSLARAALTLTTDITATTSAPTPLNIAQHSYFNLGGHDKGTILGHRLQLHADHYTPVDAEAIPTGDISRVAGTPFDFTQPRLIGERIAATPPGPGGAYGGYDHNWVLFGLGPRAKDLVTNGMASALPRPAAVVSEPSSGRVLEVLTTAPGIQFYSGNFLDGSVRGKGGVAYGKHAGLCLETQGFPDSVNQAAFPSVIVTPDTPYHHVLVYSFSHLP